MQTHRIPSLGQRCSHLAAFFLLSGRAAASWYAVPSDQEIEKVRADFRGLDRPVGYELVHGDGNEMKIELQGGTRRFANHHSKEALIYGL